MEYRVSLQNLPTPCRADPVPSLGATESIPLYAELLQQVLAPQLWQVRRQERTDQWGLVDDELGI